jgi:hypothetical protein
VRTRRIIAFIVVALLAALASQWVINLVLPAFPSLHVLVNPPKWALHLVYEQSHPGSGMQRQARPLLITAFCLAAALFLLAGHHRPGVRRVPAGPAAGTAAGPAPAAHVRR